MQKDDLNKAAVLDVMGCRYQVCILSDSFVKVILDALGKTNTEKIWAKTERTSTVYRGKRVHVVDCVKACFSHTYSKASPFISMSATFTKDSSDDMSKDCIIADDDVLLNYTQKTFNVVGRVSLNVIGAGDHEAHTAAMVDFAVKRGIYTGEGYYTHNVEGNVHDMFNFVNDVLEYGNKNIGHYAFETSMVIYDIEAKEAGI